MRLFSTQNTHWYTVAGEPRHTVVGKNGVERPTTVRDARKLGLLPSVTNVLGIISREGLVEWRMEQAVLAALTLPRGGMETLDEFARRVVEDARARVQTAQQFGLEFHAAAQRVAANPLDAGTGERVGPWVAHYRDWFAENCERVLWAEQVLKNPALGYAGTADLLAVHRKHGLVVVDLKTQSVPEGKQPRVHGWWLYQLAAYRAALGVPVGGMNVIVNSRIPQPVVEHVWSEADLKCGEKVFEAAMRIWRVEKDYDPGREGKGITTELNTRKVEPQRHGGTKKTEDADAAERS